MGLTMRVVELECTDPLKLAEFWSAVLDASIEPGTDGVNIAPRGEQEMRLYLVEERAPVRSRSRTRLWLNPVDGALEVEVARLTALGAKVIEKRWTNRSCGLAVVVLADPEGNEFCVESSDHEVAEAVRRFEDADDDLEGLEPEPESIGVVRIGTP